MFLSSISAIKRKPNTVITWTVAVEHKTHLVTVKSLCTLIEFGLIGVDFKPHYPCVDGTPLRQMSTTICLVNVYSKPYLPDLSLVWPLWPRQECRIWPENGLIWPTLGPSMTSLDPGLPVCLTLKFLNVIILDKCGTFEHQSVRFKLNHTKLNELLIWKISNSS